MQPCVDTVTRTARRWWLPLTCLLGLAACSEAAAPVLPEGGTSQLVEPVRRGKPLPAPDSRIHILRQDVTSPRLQTYRLSFWAVKGRAATVSVDYQPAAGLTTGGRFLQFQIPSGGLVGGAGGIALNAGDSVQITLTIDPTTFSVGFEPAGVRFSPESPANLQFWFHHADPDLNHDGAVNSTDEALCAQLSIWYRQTPNREWIRLSSQRDLAAMAVGTDIHHFSGYAVSW